MQDIVNRLKRTPLSENDIRRYLGPGTKVKKYSDIMSARDVNSLLGKRGFCIFLLETSKDFGHWMCLKKTKRRGKTIISFFDSYGGFPDSQKRYVNANYLIRSKQNYNKIRVLMREAAQRYDYILEYSERRLQNFNTSKIATCGYWCCVFIESGMTVNEFYRYLNSFHVRNKDDLVCKLYYNSLMKRKKRLPRF